MSSAGLKFYLSGASSTGAVQKNARASLGGKCSATDAYSLSFRRPAALRGVRVLDVSGNCGPGIANITATTTGSLSFTAPNSATQGAAVSIAYGASATLFDGADSNKWISVYRFSADPLMGNEAITLLDTYENAWSGQRFSTAEATAGAHDYAGLFVVNETGAAITGLKLWLSSSMTGLMRIAKEAPAAGVIQTIASRTTAPTGVSWVTGTIYGAGLDIGSLADDEAYGLWRDIYVNAGAGYDPAVDCIVYYQFTQSAVNYTGTHRGLTRIQGTARHELFVSTTIPDPLVDTAKATGALPLTWGGPFTSSTRYYWCLCKRNSWGILGPPDEIHSTWINASGEEDYTPPQAPAEAALTPASDGDVTLSGAYYFGQESDSDLAADGFAWWITRDGTTPSTPGAPDGTQAFSNTDNRQQLIETITTTYDQTPVKAILRTYRTEGVDTVYSENVNVVSCTANKLGPARPIGRVAQGRAAGLWIQPNTAPSAVETVIDAGASAKWIMSAGSASLYVSTSLMWRVLYDGGNVTEKGRLYIPQAVFENYAWNTSGTSAAVVYGGTASKIFSFNVAGTKRMQLTGGTTPPVLSCIAFDNTATMPEVHPSVPAWCRYADTLFAVWDRYAEDYIVWGRITSGGIFETCIPFDFTMTASQIEALEVP